MSKNVTLEQLRNSLVLFEQKANNAIIGIDEAVQEAKRLEEKIKINGIDFNGSIDITITADPNGHEHAIVDITAAREAIDEKLNALNANLEHLEYNHEQKVNIKNVKQALDQLVVDENNNELLEIKQDIGVDQVNGQTTGIFQVIRDNDSLILETAKVEAKKRLDALIDGAPDSLNTLRELAESIAQHQVIYETFAEDLTNALANKIAKQEGYGLTKNSFSNNYVEQINELEVIEVCPECGDYPCICCPECHKHPCICCPECHKYPCICCRECGYLECKCCPTCHKYPCICRPD